MLAVAAVALALATPPFQASVTPLGRDLRATRTGRSRHADCPVGSSELRIATTTGR